MTRAGDAKESPTPGPDRQEGWRGRRAPLPQPVQTPRRHPHRRSGSMVVTDHRGPASHAASTATMMLYDYEMTYCDDDVVLVNDLRRRQDEQTVNGSFLLSSR